MAFYRRQDGCIAQLCLVHPGDGNIYKVGIWLDQAAAAAVFQEQSISLRFQLLEAADGHPEELAMQVTESGGTGRLT